MNRLLVDESFFKEQRRRAQTVSRGILGFGSQSLKSDGANERVPDFRKCNTHHGAFSRQEEKADYVDCDRMIGESDTEPSSPTSQRSTNWSATSVTFQPLRGVIFVHIFLVSFPALTIMTDVELCTCRHLRQTTAHR